MLNISCFQLIWVRNNRNTLLLYLPKKNIFFVDPLYRANFLPTVNLSQAYGKNTIHPIANIPLSNGTTYYNAGPPQSAYFANAGGNNIRGSNRGRRGNNIQQQLVRQIGQRQNGYQLKVGGTV